MAKANLSPAEMIQLATVLIAQAIPLLKPQAPNSPELIGNVISMLDELPGQLEEAFAEVACLDRLDRETERNRALIAWRFRLGV